VRSYGKANRRNAETQREIERGQNGFIREFFRLFGGAAFDDRSTIALQGGARAVRTLGWVWIWERTHPGAGRHPSKEGILRGAHFFGCSLSSSSRS